MQHFFDSDFKTDPPPPNWPSRAHSRAVYTSDIRWHVQFLGAGPPLVLLHGTGGSVHSWSHALASLAEKHTVLAIDLPGHGFSNVMPDADRDGHIYSLEGMSAAIARLLEGLAFAPVLAAGHSAGLAVLARMTLDGLLHTQRLVGFNPALIAPPEAYVRLVAPAVGLVAESSFMAGAAAWLAGATGIIPAMLGSTGTDLSREDAARYRYLCERPAHCHAALTMMSRWDLPRLARDVERIDTPMTLYAGTDDRWVPYDPLARQAARIRGATLVPVPGAGHLIPEERPDVVVGALSG